MPELSFTPSAKRMTTVLRHRTRLLAVGLLMLATLLLPTAPADAMAAPGSDGDFSTDGVRIHTSPHLRSTTVGYGYVGEGAYVHDSTVFGDWVNCGNRSTPVWDYVTDDRTGVSGWVSDCLVNSELPLPTHPALTNCHATRPLGWFTHSGGRATRCPFSGSHGYRAPSRSWWSPSAAALATDGPLSPWCLGAVVAAGRAAAWSGVEMTAGFRLWGWWNRLLHGGRVR